MYVCERLIDSVCAIEYPRDRLEIQVLDDSHRRDAGIAAAKVDAWRRAGVDIDYIHRDNRAGFKAGALENGLQARQGRVRSRSSTPTSCPTPTSCAARCRYFSNAKVGMVQVRWGHLNRDFSLLTQAQAMMLDGHFIIEHTARNRSGRFFNFNGTAGIWRRQAIDDAGGWQHDTLTEDSISPTARSSRAGSSSTCPRSSRPAEVPVEMNAFKSQQHRWAKGSIQTAKKLLPAIFRSDLPWAVKLEAFFHLTNNLAYPLMVVLRS